MKLRILLPALPASILHRLNSWGFNFSFILSHLVNQGNSESNLFSCCKLQTLINFPLYFCNNFFNWVLLSDFLFSVYLSLEKSRSNQATPSKSFRKNSQEPTRLLFLFSPVFLLNNSSQPSLQLYMGLFFLKNNTFLLAELLCLYLPFWSSSYCLQPFSSIQMLHFPSHVFILSFLACLPLC